MKNLRAELNVSQAVFARVLGVSKKTVEAWEAGRNVPSGSARRLLEVIQKDKGILRRDKILVLSLGGRIASSSTKKSPDDLRPVYGREDLERGVRGTYLTDYRAGTTRVVLKPEAAKRAKRPR